MKQMRNTSITTSPPTSGSFAITRRPSERMAEAELTHLSRGLVDFTAAEQQHKNYRDTLRSSGLRLIDLPALDDYPDCAFVEDVALCLPEVSLLCRPGASSRRGEVDSVATVLPTDRPLLRIAPPATIDGGDVLIVGKTLFVGVSTRTNEAAVSELRRLLLPYNYNVMAVRVTGSLHLKTAVTALASDLLVINSKWVDASAFSSLKQVEVAPGEPFAANTLSIAQSILCQASFPATAERIARQGFAVQLLDIAEFAGVEAGLTCLSIIVA